jgi:hypothetical protein
MPQKLEGWTEETDEQSNNEQAAIVGLVQLI